MISNKNKGFTLAEIIISMTIIGVIAAITIPALLVSTSEKALNAQKKALLARMSQAMSQIEDLRVYASTKGTGASISDNGSAMNFINSALSKVYRITEVCAKDDISTTCMFPEEITVQDGSIIKLSDYSNLISFINNDAAAGVDTFNKLNTDLAGFKTANGESIVLFYNPKCHGSDTNGYFGGNAASAMCLNIIYDLNGRKEAPNEVGKDVGFMTVFFPKDPVIVAPVPYAKDTTAASGSTINSYATASAACKKDNKTLILPTSKEGMSIALNKRLTNITAGKYVVSGAGSTDIYNVDVSTLAGGSSESWPGGIVLRCIYND